MSERRCLICNRLDYNDTHMDKDVKCDTWPEWYRDVTSYRYRGYTVVKFGAKWVYGPSFSLDDTLVVDNPTEAFLSIDYAEGAK